MYRTAYVEIDDTQRLQCAVPGEMPLHVGDQCIVQCGNLMEYGQVFRIDDEEEGNGHQRRLNHILRCATLQDHAKADENSLMGKMAMGTCVAKARKYGLAMRLVRVRYSFDRSVLMVQFTAEERVDFRELVRDLAGELHTRIEMKQIGVRDEAAIIGGLGPCGRRLCCCTWLRHFESINVKMAKAQRLTLTPGAINGMCGRLKCCLRYEYEHYKECARHVPREGTVVELPEGKGCIISRDILTRQITVRMEDERMLTCSAADIRHVLTERRRSRKGARGDDDGGGNGRDD